MPTEAVVDSSVIPALVTLEKYSEWASQAISRYDYFHILDLAYYEVANALKAKTLRREISNKAAVEAFTKSVRLMNLYAIHSFSEVIADALALSLELNITAYDGAHLSLAKQAKARLLTLDTKLMARLRSTEYYNLMEAPDK